MTRPSASDIRLMSKRNSEAWGRVAPSGLYGDPFPAENAKIAKPAVKARQQSSDGLPGHSKHGLTLELPFPPSKNALDVRRVAVSKAGKRYSARSDSPVYRDYKEAVRLIVLKKLGTNCAIKGNVRIGITFYPPDLRRRDLLNGPEALADALTYAGVWIDDVQIKRVEWIEWGDVVKNGAVNVEIREI